MPDHVQTFLKAPGFAGGWLLAFAGLAPIVVSKGFTRSQTFTREGWRE